MEPVTSTIVSGVMSILMPYVTRGAKEFVSMAGKVAYNKAKSFMETLKARLTGDKEATDALNRLEERPERYEKVVESILYEKLDQDTNLADELARLLEELGPEINVIQRMDIGADITGVDADDIVGGRINVEQDIGQGINITGARVRRVGGRPERADS